MCVYEFLVDIGIERGGHKFVCVCVGCGEEKKESLFKSLGGVCQPHRMWPPSTCNIMSSVYVLSG